MNIVNKKQLDGFLINASFKFKMEIHIVTLKDQRSLNKNNDYIITAAVIPVFVLFNYRTFSKFSLNGINT